MSYQRVKALIKLKSPVIVEGKYDKITLENVVEARIIPTNGFSFIKDAEKCRMIRALAKKYGVIVITDSDFAGNMIRARIKNIVGDGKIINVYVPRISGKEKRKIHGGKEGILGVEGMSPETLMAALERSGVTGEALPENRRKISKTDLYLKGLSGTQNSGENRRRLLKKLDLPQNLSPNAMLDILNTILTYEEFIEVTQNA